MRQIQTEIIINAPIEKVWAVLTDFSSYPAWNPFISKIEGELKVNHQLIVTINPPNKKPMVFKPRVITVSPYEFAWVGRLLMPGIFDGTHRFLLLPQAENSVKFLHSEKFEGLLHIPIFNLLAESTKAGFQEMNQALKKYCES